ncbi:hypothetical protein G9A89_007709 [Geosiphon pyriformis]|nr:hypothetical protein G9A89_007709 [Geosiphon pyriformis]
MKFPLVDVKKIGSFSDQLECTYNCIVLRQLLAKRNFNLVRKVRENWKMCTVHLLFPYIDRWGNLDFWSQIMQSTPQHVHKFPIHPIGRFKGACAVYEQPLEVTSYSHDGERIMHLDDRELRYYYPPTLNEKINLSEGYESFVERNSSIEPLNCLIDALIDRQKSLSSNILGGIDVVSWRGIFTKILCTPFARNDAWEFGATLWNVSTFIAEHETIYTQQNSRGVTPQHKKMMYWGYKFESLCTIAKPPSEIISSDDPELIHRKTSIVNTNIQYCSVARTTLGPHRIIMGAEVDCIGGHKPQRSNNPIKEYIELKTSKIIRTDREQHNFEKFKLMKTWAQSFLIGIPRIIFGFRNNEGFLEKIQEFNTLEIPRLVRGKQGMWDAAVCLNFASQFLQWVREVVVIDDPHISYTIAFRPPFKEIEIINAGTGNSVVAEKFLAVNTIDEDFFYKEDFHAPSSSAYFSSLPISPIIPFVHLGPSDSLDITTSATSLGRAKTNTTSNFMFLDFTYTFCWEIPCKWSANARIFGDCHPFEFREAAFASCISTKSPTH